MYNARRSQFRAPKYRDATLSGLTPRETIVALLETRADALAGGFTGEGPGSRGDRVLLMSPLWTDGSYEELDRVLKHMRNQGYQQAVQGVSLHACYWHVMEWYIRAEKVRRNEPKTAKKAGKVVQLRDKDGELVTTPKMVYRRHKDVRESKVNLGIDWILSNWDAVNPQGRRPQLPRELWEVLAA